MEVDVRRTVPLVCVCLFLLTVAESAFAHQRLFVRMLSEVVELDSRQPSVGTVLRRVHVPEQLGLRFTNVVTFGGGQSLAWAGDGAVLLLDTSSGAIRRFTFPDFLPLGVIGTDGNAKLIVIGHLGSFPDSKVAVLVADARSGRMHFVDLGSSLGPMAYASESDVLFVGRLTPITPTNVQAIDKVDAFQLASGALIKTLDVSAAYVTPPSRWEVSMSVNAAGTRLFVSPAGAGTVAFDTLSGVVIARSATLDAPFADLDELRNRFVTLSLGRVAAYSADSLSFLGSVSVPTLQFWQDLDVSGLSATTFVLESALANTVCESQLHALDAETGRVRRTVKLTNTLGEGACDHGVYEFVDPRPAVLIRITEPAPPSAPTADVAVRHVTLNWRAPFGATRYEVEAGSAPGLANITTIKVSDPKLVIDGVPSGAYHVRVRAINTIGKSGASQDVRVVVP